MIITRGSTSASVYFMVRSVNSNPPGLGLSGLTSATPGFVITTHRFNTASWELPSSPLTLASQSIQGAWITNGFSPMTTNQPGRYRLDIPNSAIQTGAAYVDVIWSGAGAIEDYQRVMLIDGDPYGVGVSVSTIASGVWAQPTRSLTTAQTASVDTASIALGVWSYVSRTLTSLDTSSIVSGVWSYTTRSLNTTASVSTATIASGVWMYGTRTITTLDTSSIVSGVWSYPTRSLTTSMTASVDTASISLGVWSYVSRSLTTSMTASVDTASISLGVWSYATRSLTLPVTASLIPGAITSQSFVSNAIQGSHLSSSATQKIATDYLDLTDGVETGLTPRGALRLGAAADAGLVSSSLVSGVGTVWIRNAVANSKVRITATVDNGDRDTVVTDTT